MEKETKIILFSLLLAALCSLVFCDVWRASVVKNLDALVSSCVVVPCTFSHPRGNLPTSKLRGIWHLSDITKIEEIIYHDDPTRILDNFKGRTKLLGQLGQDNCTLEIMKVKDHDNGPFCFRIELVNQVETDKFSFVEACAGITMLHEPPKPKLSHFKTITPGKPSTITCSVRHTCPSHMPNLTWTHKTKQDDLIVMHKDMHSGSWETESILTFTAEEEHDDTELTCTATFEGGKKSSTSLTLNVKYIKTLNHIIIPIVVVFAMSGIFGVFCVLMVKKYKTRIAELQNQDGSVWNRMSRMSRRFRSGGAGPSSRPERRSIWSRFSRRPARDTGEGVHRPNNMSPQSCGQQKINKARIPSPKSQPKSYNYKEDLDDGDDYMNTADLNVYGNI